MAIYLVSGMSGTGKTTIVKSLEKDGFWKECISHTTRPMRDGEIDGVVYNFVSLEEFEKMKLNNEFIETVPYSNNFYGVTRKEVEKVLSENENCVIIVEYDGYKQIKAIYPNAIGIFLTMKKEDCYQNMLNRGDTISNANIRIDTYEEELKNAINYDYILENQRGHLDYIKNFIKRVVN